MSRSPDSKFRVLLPTSDEDAVQQLEETLSPGLGDCAKQGEGQLAPLLEKCSRQQAHQGTPHDVTLTSQFQESNQCNL